MVRIGSLRRGHARPHADHGRTRALGIATALFVVGLLFLGFLGTLNNPRIIDAVYTTNGGQPEPLTFPLLLPFGRQSVDISVLFHADGLSPTKYRVIPDNCLTSLRVNEQELPIDPLESCNGVDGLVFDFGPHLRPGNNVVTMHVENTGGTGSVRFAVDRADPLRLLPLIVFLLLLAGYGFFLCTHFGFSRATIIVLSLTFLAVTLRAGYAAITPIAARGHDYDGHWRYIEYVANNWAIPPMHGDKQFYHPPLYYFLNAPIMHAGVANEWPVFRIEKAIQALSVLFSIVTFLLGLWIVSLFYPPSKSPVPFTLASSIVATLPSLVFFAPRVNNDVLYQVFAFACVGLIVRFWQKGKTLDWILLVLAWSLGMLTKGNMMLFAPLIGLVLVCRRGMSWKRKAGLISVGAMLAVVLMGWYQIPHYRESSDGRVAIIGNIGEQTNHAPTSYKNFFTFNPLGILRHPFNDPYYDIERRMNVPEYFFRSAFYGEYRFPDAKKPIAVVIVLCGMLLLIPLIVRWFGDVVRRTYTMAPLRSMTLLLLAGAFVARLTFATYSMQDFRYSLPLLLPVAVYVAREKLGKMRMRWPQRAVIVVLCMANVAFLASIWLKP